MYTGNLIYQAERPLSRTEQQQVDIANAELVRAVSRCWHALAAPLRLLRAAGRPAAERLPESRPAECQPAECLPGRAA